MESICSMVDCYNSIDAVISQQFFPFPKDFDLCMQWVQNCGRAELFEDFAYGGAHPFVNKVVCSDHFNQSHFIEPDRIGNGLKPRATPICNLSLIKKELKDDSADNNSDSNDIKGNVDFIKSESEELADTDSTQDPACNDFEEPLSENSCLPLLIVLNDKDDCNSSSQKSQRAFQAAWKRALESVEEREARNRANALRNAYKRANETEEQRKARNSANASRNAHRRANETDDQRRDRLYKNAVRAALRRSMESEFEQQERRKKNALRSGFRRTMENETQRSQRRLKDKIRSAERRKNESELQSKIRRYNDAVRAAFRRNNETEEQKQQRRMYDGIRAARRRSSESLEQRIKRLKADRERAAKRRLFKKLGIKNIQNSFFSSELDLFTDDLNIKNVNEDNSTYSDDELDSLCNESGDNCNKSSEFSDNTEYALDSFNESSKNNSSNLPDKKGKIAMNDNSVNSNVILNSNTVNGQDSAATLSAPEIVWCT